MSAWTNHVARWRDCTKCPLCEQRTNIVLARGQVPCDVLFIGEAPGASEDALGLPFVGPAGKLLDSDEKNRPGIIQRSLPCHLEWDAKVVRHKWVMEIPIAFSNLVACFPAEAKASGDNEPSHREILACRPRLEEFVALAQPKLIVCVGGLATGYVALDPTRGRCDITHPAAILRMPLAQKQMAVQKVVVQLRRAVEDIV